MDVVRLVELKRDQRLEPIMVRIPPEAKEQALKVAAEKSKLGKKVSVTDVYRTAILNFLSSISTDSRDASSEAQPA